MAHKTSVRFDNSPFVRSHGKEPKGRGSWAFQIDGLRDARIEFSPSMTLAEARRWMAERVQAMPACEGVAQVWVNVLP